jgi:primosomal replication protein N
MDKTNRVNLTGIIKDIRPSHTIDDVEYSKANIVVKRLDGKEDILCLKFKRFSCPYKDNQVISLSGNIRSYSRQIEGKSKVDIYVFTYFDDCDEVPEGFNKNNFFEVQGVICKSDDLRTVSSGKQNIHFILANNIISENSRLNSYLPCVAWGNVAKGLSKCPVGQNITIRGEFHSKEYKKIVSDSGDYEIRIAHELVVTSYELN